MPARAGTELEAANLALAELGEPPIGGLTEANGRARAVNLWFGTVRDDVLCERYWGFATAWARPAADVAQSLGPLKNRYPMPEDCLEVRFLANPTTGEQNADDWDIEASAINIGDTPGEAKFVVTNATAPLICYTRRITAPRLWDAEFVSIFAKRLAAAIAPTIAKDINAGDKKNAEADDKVDEAALRDAREEGQQRISRNTSWVRSRQSGVARSSRGW